MIFQRKLLKTFNFLNSLSEIMDAFLIIVCIVIAILMMVVNFYLLAIYCHPDDRGWGVHWFCRALVLFGFTLSWAQVLMLPLDVANTK